MPYYGLFTMAHPTMETKLSRDQAIKVNAALQLARQKLHLYFQNSDGRYLGGMEFSALIKLIDEARAITPVHPPSSAEAGR